MVRFILRFTLLTALIMLSAGCSSPLFEDTIFDQRENVRAGGAQRQLAEIKTTSQMTNLECQRLAEQINALNLNQRQLDARLRNIESSVSSSAHVNQDVAALRQDLAQVRVERDQLRKEITDDLARRIEKIAARQQQAIEASHRQPRQTSTRPASSTANAGSGYEHKVERGQTLSEIARGYNTTVDKIIKANKIKDASTIRVGQVLFIPD